jgi:predicted nucleotidyltransferase
MSLSHALFSSVQRRVLALLFGHPERSFYAAEIVRIVNSGTGAVDRELSRLQRSGLVSMDKVGKQKHYRANPKSPIYHEMVGLVRKTMGLREPLRESLESFADKIEAAFIYGSVAKEIDTAESDIDLMIIGKDITYSDIYKELDATEKTLNRPVNPNVLTVEDWQRKLRQKDSFVARVNAQPKIFIIGTEDDLRI